MRKFIINEWVTTGLLVTMKWEENLHVSETAHPLGIKANKTYHNAKHHCLCYSAVMSPLVGFQLPLRTMEIRRAGKFVA
jgi:hypothetical protein